MNGVTDSMRRIVVAVIMGIMVTACTSPAAQPGTPAGGKPLVVATTTIIADMARNVAGDRVEVRSLLPSGADPHTFSATPADVRMVADSDLVLYNGGGLEEWLDKLVQNAGGQRQIVVVSEGIPLRRVQETAADGEAEGSHEGEGDPHLWFDVKNAMAYTGNIRDALVAMDPAGAEVYRANADAYLADLENLDRWVQDHVAQIPPERRKLVTNHDQFGYFADRYGFEVVGTVLGATPGREPSAQEVARLIDSIKAAGVPAIFTETTMSATLADRVAADAGVKIVSQLYTDSVGPAGSGADTYVGLIRTDVEKMVEALR